MKTLAEIVNDRIAELDAQRAVEAAWQRATANREAEAAAQFVAYMAEHAGIALGDEVVVFAQEQAGAYAESRRYVVTLFLANLGALRCSWECFNDVWQPADKRLTYRTQTHDGNHGPVTPDLAAALLWLTDGYPLTPDLRTAWLVAEPAAA